MYSWWQTALVSLIPSATGAAIALLGVWLTGSQTDKRDARRAEADEIAQRVANERQVIAGVLASLSKMLDASHTRYSILSEAAADPNYSVHADTVRRIHDRTDAFASALALARVTVTNPLARPAIKELRTCTKAFADALEDGTKSGSWGGAAEQLALFERSLVKAGDELEHAAMNWDGRLPPVDDPKPDPARGPRRHLESQDGA